jgi:4-hydroxybenzoyl-CoA reductase subunit beta
MLPLHPFAMHSPPTVDEALALLAKHGEAAMLIAGGTDLVPNMKHGLFTPKHLVSLGRVDALRGVSRRGDAVHVGAMTSLEATSENDLVRTHARALALAAGSVGGPHHRRMGTLGGNLCLDTRCRYYNQTHFWRDALGYCLKKDGTVCHVVAGGRRCVAAASNDTAAAAIALGATVHVVGGKGARDIAAADFYTADGVKNTVLERGEVVTGLSIPIRERRKSGYEKLRRRGSIDFPLLSVGVCVDFEGDRAASLEVVVSALAAKPRRVKAPAAAWSGKSASEIDAAAIGAQAHRECNPLENVEGDAPWRREMVAVIVKRALASALA